MFMDFTWLFEEYLIEDLNSSYEYYKNKLKREDFDKLISYDPTFKLENNKLGTYGKWILDRFIKGDISKSDFGHLKDVLTRFENNKKYLTNKDINFYKTINDIDEILNSLKINLSHRQEVRQNQKDRHNAITEPDLIFEGNNWKVYSPSSYANSCKLGEDSSWCTASTESDYYYKYYTRRGPLYIIINKNNPEEKYQFHIETSSYMDSDDYAINPFEVLNAAPELKPFFENKIFAPYLKDLHIAEDAPDNTPITLQYELSDILDIMDRIMARQIYRSALSGEAIKEILYWDPYLYDFSDISNNEVCEALRYYKKDLEKSDFIAQKLHELNLTVEDLQTLIEDLDAISVKNSSIDTYALQKNLIVAVMRAYEEGTLVAAHNDVEEKLTNTISDVFGEKTISTLIHLDGEELGINIKTTVREIKNLMTDNTFFEDDSEFYDLDGYILYLIGEKLDIMEPQYGWNAFDTETFVSEVEGAFESALA